MYLKNIKPVLVCLWLILTGCTSTQESGQIENQQKANTTKKQPQKSVQVVNQEVVNITGTEAIWLPGQIQDKLKSNLQEYLDMRTVVDSKSEAALKKLQAESESNARDENTAIEFGKITTAKFAFFVKLRKTESGYTISADFTDLKTGEQLATVVSKEYTKPEYLYGSTGAADEITLLLADKLGIHISALNKNLLTNGSAGFSIDEQLALARQNEEQFKKMMEQYDSDLAKLSVSNDISVIENKRKIEAEKSLLVEKQNAEKKRQEELKAQKEREQADAKLEAERSIALKTQRDQMAKQATEVRKLKMEKLGVLGQINVIEGKKKALVEIRQGVESRSQELYAQLEKDREREEKRIRDKSYCTVELGGDGQPTKQAKTRRENQVIQSYKDLTNKFFADCDTVKASTAAQESALLAEIRADQKTLTKVRTVSSMGDELKVSFGTYEGSKNGWNAFLSLYSDGVLLYTDNFIVSYEALSGKKAPTMETELRDSVIKEYTNNVDMYSSLLTRGDPIIYFEIDYSVKAENDDKPSEYEFNFSKIRAINTLSGKTVQISNLEKNIIRTMKPERDIRKTDGIKEQERNHFDLLIKNLEAGYSFSQTERFTEFETITGKKFRPNHPMNLLVTQKMYLWVTGKNPCEWRNENDPVVNVSWYDAIYFCNKLSEIMGKKPAYSVDGTTDVTKWTIFGGTIEVSPDGFQLPEMDIWRRNAIDGVVLEPTTFGEWCNKYDYESSGKYRYIYWNEYQMYYCKPNRKFDNVGFRVVCNW